jgi:hypothetical protein
MMQKGGERGGKRGGGCGTRASACAKAGYHYQIHRGRYHYRVTIPFTMVSNIKPLGIDSIKYQASRYR